MRLTTTAALAATLSVATLATGCSAFSDDAGADGQVEVAAAFYPLAWAAERIADGTDTEVELLTQPGTEPHDLELDVQATAAVAGADLVVFEASFQPAVDDSVEQNAEGAVLDAADVVDLMEADEHVHDHAHGDEAEGEEHAEEEHAEEGHEGHDHGDHDPHFWQDPLRVADLGDAIADELATIDPDNAATYESNAEDLRADLVALDEAYAAGLATCERDTIVVSHDAFGYLEKYGLHIDSIVGLSPDAEPTPAALGEIRELIETEGITTVFSEPLKPALGEALADDLGLVTGVLDPIEGLTTETADEDYLSLMEGNLAAIAEANACS